jgi:hypothetical protein
MMYKIQPEDYILLEDDSPETLREKVMIFIRNGYALYGQPFTCERQNNVLERKVHFFQAVIKFPTEYLFEYGQTQKVSKDETECLTLAGNLDKVDLLFTELEVP